MIAACPKCAARYRIEKQKLGEGGARLRCSRCESVFRVRAPAEQPASVESAAPQETPSPEPAPPTDKKRAQVLVAMPDADLAKQTTEALRARGLHCMAVFDGVDAMLEIQRQEPVAVVLAAELPKMFGFQVCEIVKRNASLRGIHVVLAGAVHHPDRYRRSPSDLYGADSYLEVPDLPDALFPVLQEAGILNQPSAPEEKRGSMPLRPKPASPVSGPSTKPSVSPSPLRETSAPSSSPPEALRREKAADASAAGPLEAAAPARLEAPKAPVVAAPPEPAKTPPQPTPSIPVKPAAEMAPPVPATPQAPAAPPSEERAQAERLARIIVSDIVLYNEEKFSAAVAAGDVGQAMASELDEGRGLFERRIDASVRAKNDFLLEELLRVARARGME